MPYQSVALSILMFLTPLAEVTPEQARNKYLHVIHVMSALGALQWILFGDVSPPASLLGCLLCLDMLPLSDACSRASTGLPCIGGPRRR